MKETSKSQIATINSDVLRVKESAQMTVGQLESRLLALFPASDALEWDKTGLLCGDPEASVSDVAIALDASETAVRRAAALGANVLITHHPAFLDAPDDFMPLARGNAAASYTGSVIWAAVEEHLALINFHTALDVSFQAAQVLPHMLGLDLFDILDPIDGSQKKGFGQLCHVREEESPLNLSQLAARCTSVFGRVPRVWGDPQTVLETLVTATGSATDLAQLCLQANADCLICGEIRYHSALDSSQRGLCIIELGHDVSELPLCAVLASACAQIGIPDSSIHLLDQSSNWWTPEAVRR